MLHREYSNKVMWPGLKIVETSFLGRYTIFPSQSVCFSHINTLSTLLPTHYPHDQGPEDTSHSHCDHSSQFYIPQRLNELHNYSGTIDSPILPSSLAPFLSLCCPTATPPFLSLITSYFFLRLNIGNAAIYQQ